MRAVFIGTDELTIVIIAHSKALPELKERWSHTLDAPPDAKA